MMSSPSALNLTVKHDSQRVDLFKMIHLCLFSSLTVNPVQIAGIDFLEAFHSILFPFGCMSHHWQFTQF